MPVIETPGGITMQEKNNWTLSLIQVMHPVARNIQIAGLIREKFVQPGF